MDIAQVIRDTAARYGQDPDVWIKAANIESSGNPNAASKTSSARGLFQFTSPTWAQYGRGDVFDPATNADAAMRLARDNGATFKNTMGRDPTPGETYLMHQQGAGGATKLLQNPDAPAAQILGLKEVTLNGGHPEMSSRDFANQWTSRFDGAGPPSPGAAPAAPIAQTAQPAEQAAAPQAANPLANVFSSAAGQLTQAAPKREPRTTRAAGGTYLVGA